MNEQTWKTVISVQGEIQAEVLRGLLESQGISVHLSQEGVAHAYGLGVGPLSEVEIFVPEKHFDAAQTVIEKYQAGDFEELGDQSKDDTENP